MMNPGRQSLCWCVTVILTVATTRLCAAVSAAVGQNLHLPPVVGGVGRVALLTSEDRMAGGDAGGHVGRGQEVEHSIPGERAGHSSRVTNVTPNSAQAPIERKPSGRGATA